MMRRYLAYCPDDEPLSDGFSGCSLGKAKKEYVPCRYCGRKDGDGHLFWECTFHFLQHCIDNLNVARSFGRLLDHGCLAKPLPLVKDGDLVAIAQYMIRIRGRDTVRVTKVKGHAEDSDVQQGRVRLEDQLGNAESDAAAVLGRRHQSELHMDARRIFLKVRNHWYPIMLQLHRFMIAVARVAGFCP